jgi:NAD-dependent SIR2 family protein deacetylase
MRYRMNEIDLAKMEIAVQWIKSADGLLITAGAGMGVDSGLPDFRGPEGFWRAHPGLRQEGLTFTEMANPAAFRNDPERAWGFYGHRLMQYRSTVPHRGFEILRKWASKMQHGAFVFTSNVDGQFQKAGFAESRIAECHGSIHYLQCSVPCHSDIWPVDPNLSFMVDVEACRLLTPMPRCNRCGVVARSNILMFYDGAWLDSRAEQQAVRLRTWLAQVEQPVVIEIGAGRAIPTVRNFSARQGARIVRINPDDWAINPAFGVGIPGRGLKTLEQLDELLSNGP